jgi:hypothetical protein
MKLLNSPCAHLTIGRREQVTLVTVQSCQVCQCWPKHEALEPRAAWQSCHALRAGHVYCPLPMPFLLTAQPPLRPSMAPHSRALRPPSRALHRFSSAPLASAAGISLPSLCLACLLALRGRPVDDHSQHLLLRRPAGPSGANDSTALHGCRSRTLPLNAFSGGAMQWHPPATGVGNLHACSSSRSILALHVLTQALAPLPT